MIQKLLLDIKPNETEALKKDLAHNGQLDPGVITHDGAVVNANRRMAILSRLYEETSDPKFEYLRVTRLPKVGRVGENVVKAYEVSRLLSLGHAVEARCVRRISNLRVNAGYDIQSFDSSSPTMAYDRFIEVKSAKQRKMRFFWTENEIRIATRLGKRYWIYFQGAIDVARKTARDKPIMICDPVNSILGDATYKTTAQGYVVESDVSGERI